MYCDYLPKRWDKAIRKLGSQFCVPTIKINNIISSVRAMRIEDNDKNYQKAWRMLFDLL